MKTAGVILSYNNPEMTDRLVENIRARFSREMPLIVLDNGSKESLISKYTTHRIPKNCRMTWGFNAGLSIAKKKFEGYDNYWLFTNDCFFEDTGVCPLESSEKFLAKYPEIGILHPSESSEVNVCYDVKNDPKVNGVKLVIEYDIVCPIFTSKALEAMGGKFNEALYQGWGLDHESSYIVRKAGLVVGINHEIIVGHNTSSTYDKGRDEMHPNRNSFYNAALQEMYSVFGAQYGPGWHSTFMNTHNESKGKILS